MSHSFAERARIVIATMTMVMAMVVAMAAVAWLHNDWCSWRNCYRRHTVVPTMASTTAVSWHVCHRLLVVVVIAGTVVSMVSMMPVI